MPAEKPPASGRPAIWVEGQQNPPFAPRAFARASLIFARQALAAGLGRAAQALDRLGRHLARRALPQPLPPAGWTRRVLPDLHRRAAWAAGAGRILTRSACLLGRVPAQTAKRPVPIPRRPTDLRRAAPAQPRPRLPDADLEAIRGLLADPPPPALAADMAPNLAPAAPAAAAIPALAEAAARALAYGLLLPALPFGALRALLAHLNGQDLRLLDR